MTVIAALVILEINSQEETKLSNFPSLCKTVLNYPIPLSYSTHSAANTYINYNPFKQLFFCENALAIEFLLSFWHLSFLVFNKIRFLFCAPLLFLRYEYLITF